MKKKLLAAVLACMMLLGCLAGCSSQPKTALDVVKAYQAHDDASVFNLAGTISMDFSMEAEGLSLEMPISIGMDMAVKNGLSHGTMDISMSVFGEDMDESTEMYMDDTAVYTYDSEKGTWLKEEISDETASAISLVDELLVADVFNEATMSYDKSVKTYTVAVPGSALAKTDMFSSLLESMDVDAADDEETQRVIDAFSQGTVEYVFDENCYLTSIALKDMVYAASDEETDEGYDMTLTLGMELVFSNYGAVEDIVIPEDVLAALTEDEYYDTYGYGDEDWDSLFGDDFTYDYDIETEDGLIDDASDDIIADPAFNDVPAETSSDIG